MVAVYISMRDQEVFCSRFGTFAEDAYSRGVAMKRFNRLSKEADQRSWSKSTWKLPPFKDFGGFKREMYRTTIAGESPRIKGALVKFG